MTTTNIYVLKLEDNCYYVGKSDNLQARLQDHFNGNGSAWTKRHPPIEVVETRPNVSPYEEDKATKEYMAKYGIHNVRGGSYVTINLDTNKYNFLMDEIRMTEGYCTRCGYSTHFVTDCYAKIDIDGNLLEPVVPKLCTRCGRDTHDASVCHNKTHINGYWLDSVPIPLPQPTYEHTNPLTHPMIQVELASEPLKTLSYNADVHRYVTRSECCCIL